MHAYGLRRLSDERLGSRLGAGDAAAFDELYRRYVHRLAAYGAHLLGDAAAGEDVAQSALLKAYGALRAGTGPERMRPWLYRIAHNAALDVVARRREILSPAAIDEATVENKPFAGALVEAVAALPDRQRRVYALREVHGLRIDETAAELGLSAAQVEQALFAARNRLAELLTFGERLSCVAVRRLATGPLEPQERRSLKTHLRSCPSCRTAVAESGAALSTFPFLDWLRALPAVLAGGGAPVVAKVGIVAATATLSAGVPLTLRDLWQPKPTLTPITAAQSRVTRPAHRRAVAVPAVAPASSSATVTTLAATSRHKGATAGMLLVVAQHGDRSHGNDAPLNISKLVLPSTEDGGHDGGRTTTEDGGGDGKGGGGIAPAAITSSSGDGGQDGSDGKAHAQPGTSTVPIVVTSDPTDDGSQQSGDDGSSTTTRSDGGTVGASDSGGQSGSDDGSSSVTTASGGDSANDSFGGSGGDSGGSGSESGGGSDSNGAGTSTTGGSDSSDN